MHLWGTLLWFGVVYCALPDGTFINPGSSDCATMKPMCVDPRLHFKNGDGIGLSSEPNIPTGQTGGYGCWDTREINSQWFTLKIKKSGTISFWVVSDTDADLDFIIWGPFDSPGQPSCGANLISTTQFDTGNQLSCGYLRGASVRGNILQETRSLENATIPNAVEGKYYTFLVNSDIANTSFHLQATNSMGETDCDMLRGANNFSVQLDNTANMTNATTDKPHVGQVINITFLGYRLDTRSSFDSAKAVKFSDTCDAVSTGTDREGLNLGPGDNNDTSTAEWITTFLLPGKYKICYQPVNKSYVQIGPTFEVFDLRVRPPVRLAVGVVDAVEIHDNRWFSFFPTTVVAGENATLTFSGFITYSYDEVYVKVVVASCKEEYASVPGGGPYRLGPHHQATVKQLGQVGKYRVCIKHREEWEEMPEMLTVTTPNAIGSYFGYFSCAQLIAANQDFCGCYHNEGSMPNSPPILLPLEFPSKEITSIVNVKSPLINQGCCGRNSEVRKRIVETVGVNWGLCSDKKTQGPFWFPQS